MSREVGEVTQCVGYLIFVITTSFAAVVQLLGVRRHRETEGEERYRYVTTQSKDR